MSSMNELAKELVSAIDERDKRKASAYDTQATVLSKDRDVLWVHIPGGVDRTPVDRTVDANPGDQIMVRVSNGRAWSLGNKSNPPTDDTMALAAHGLARVADENSMAAMGAAVDAQASADMARGYALEARDQAILATAYADQAKEQADIAQQEAIAAANEADAAREEAIIANTAANGALTQASVVEDVAGTLSWIQEHASYVPTDDDYIVSGRVYFTSNGTDFTPIAIPTEYDIYEQSEDHSVSIDKTYYVPGDLRIPVDDPTGNPYSLGYYEYVLSTDTNVEGGKTYYILEDDEWQKVVNPEGNPRELGYYEFQRSVDREVKPNKTYYIRELYTIVDDPIFDPNEEGYYEAIPSEDTIVNSEKRYYLYSNDELVLIEDAEFNPSEDDCYEYVLTNDTVVDPEKVYYFLNDGNYQIVTDPSGDPSEQHWYEFIITEDTENSPSKRYYDSNGLIKHDLYYELTESEDTDNDPSKNYYDAYGNIEVNQYYELIHYGPKKQGWFMLDVQSAQSDFIMKHLAITGAGLWILPTGINVYNYYLTPEIEVDPNKTYYERTGSGTTDDPYIWTAIDNPTGNPRENGWYLAFTSTPNEQTRALTGADYKMLLSNDGMHVYDPYGVEASIVGENILFASNRYQRIGSDSAFIAFDPQTNKIIISGQSVEFAYLDDQLDNFRNDIEQDISSIDVVVNGGYSGDYILSEDTTVVEDKPYYIVSNDWVEAEITSEDNPRLKGLYEYINGQYVRTEDSAPIPGKTYYVAVNLSVTPVTPEPGDNPHHNGWYEREYRSSIIEAVDKLHEHVNITNNGHDSGIQVFSLYENETTGERAIASMVEMKASGITLTGKTVTERVVEGEVQVTMGESVANIDSAAMHIDNIMVTNMMPRSNPNDNSTGKFIFEARSNGHLSLKKLRG